MPGSPEYNKPNQEWRAPPKPQSASEANPLAPLLREQRGSGERSHEEMVAIIKTDLAAYMESKQLDSYNPDPVAALRDRFIAAIVPLQIAEHPEPPTGGRYDMPFAQLMMAWDLISQPYYKSAHVRGLTESAVKDDARHLGHTITLDRNEGRLLSAMAEAVGIPNPFGPMTPEKQAPK
jgi:hypothetical protein